MPTADRPSPDVTLWLERARQGDAQALEQALEHLYAEIKSIAQARMRAFAPSHTLQPTALVNEAMLRLVGRSTPWESRGHFLGVAARAMRSILADHRPHAPADARPPSDAVVLDAMCVHADPMNYGTRSSTIIGSLAGSCA